METGVRRLTLDDVDAFRALRLFALEESPESFTSDLAYEQSQPRAWFERVISNQHALGYFAQGRMLGIVIVGTRERLANTAHRYYLWGMYVSPELRGQGAGRKLMQAALAAAEAEVEMVQLGVSVRNEAAKRLYSSLGFTVYGYEERSLKIGGRYLDEILMVKFFR